MVVDVTVQMDFNDLFKVVKEHEDKDLISFMQHVKDEHKVDDFMRFIINEYEPIKIYEIPSILATDEFYIRDMINLD